MNKPQHMDTREQQYDRAPGKIIERLMKEKGINKANFASRMKRPGDFLFVNELLASKRYIDAEIARDLRNVFGGTVAMYQNIQLDHDRSCGSLASMW